jgi:cell division protein FtsL
MDILAAIGIAAIIIASVVLVIGTVDIVGRVFDTARDTDRLRKEIEKAKEAHNELFDRVNEIESTKPSKAK